MVTTTDSRPSSGCPPPLYPKGTHLAVGVQWCPHALLQQPQCKGLQYVQVVSHLVAQWCCAMDDALEDSESRGVSVGSLGEEEWVGLPGQGFLPYR